MQSTVQTNREARRTSYRERQARYLASLPPRLKRLNRELAIDQSKHHDYVYAVHGAYKFRVAIFRNEDCSFTATTSAAGRVHRYTADLPSKAFIDLTRSLEWVVSRLEYTKNLASHENTKQDRKRS